MVFPCTPLLSSKYRLSTVQYSTVFCLGSSLPIQYSTVQYCTVQYSTVQYSRVQYSIVQYSTVQYSIIKMVRVSDGGIIKMLK